MEQVCASPPHSSWFHELLHCSPLDGKHLAGSKIIPSALVWAQGACEV